MLFDAYQKETEQIAYQQSEILAEAVEKLTNGSGLSNLEKNGILHALQVLIENAIGKAKHIIKMEGREPPISGYDSFVILVDFKRILPADLKKWNNAIGLRNRIVHDYMNIRMDVVLDLIKNRHYYFIVEFLLSPLKKS